MVWRIDDPQANEASKIVYDIARYTRGQGLDIGCGPFKAYPHFIGIDNGNHWGTEGADLTAEATDLSMFANASMDFIFSSHLLEHIVDTRLALREWWRVIRVGGHLVLYLPHKDYYPRMGTPGANPTHKHDFGPNDIRRAMVEEKFGFDLVMDEIRDQDNGPGEYGNEYSFFQVYKKAALNRPVFSCDREKPRKTACVVRYGGIGDMIQVAACLPGLKAQGYHVTLMTTPEGQKILQHDPHIDDWWIQDKDQVPNNELPAYWREVGKRFSKMVMLSESIEGSLLAYPGRVQYEWPQAALHKVMNVNYLDRIQDLAEVPHDTVPLYYPTKEEQSSAEAKRKDMLQSSGCSRLILWSMAGSSRHKINPYYDILIARILTAHPGWCVGTLGNEASQILEGTSFENEPRVHYLSGKMDIRDTIALAQTADVVVGPETGVLNSVAQSTKTAKLIMLSHSTEENLTRDWNSTTVLTPTCHCYPCHKMHLGRGDCDYGDVPSVWNIEGDATLCVLEMDPDRIYNALVPILKDAEGQKAA